MKKPPVRHYRNGPGIDVCLCGARGVSFSMTLGGVTCRGALRKVHEQNQGDPARKWKAKMAKIREAKNQYRTRTVLW